MEHGERPGVTRPDVNDQAQLLAHFVGRFERLSERFTALPPTDVCGRRAIARALYSTYDDCAELAGREIDGGLFRWVLGLLAGREEHK